MKAGSAGSIPDDATKMRQPTQPLRSFLRDVGEAVANLNTTIVGLDAVENGYEKPDSLNISWSPTNREAAARKARRFVLDSVLIRVSEALDQYIEAISKLPRFERIRDNWHNSSPSSAEKLLDIVDATFGNDCFLFIAGSLLIHWRNRVVHLNSKAKLNYQQIIKLKQASDKIEQDFSSLSVERLLKDFDEGKPTLKDISSLIAMTIRLARKLDCEINDVSQADLDALLMHYGLHKHIEKLKIETAPNKLNASIGRFLEATAPGLAEPYRSFYGS